MLNPIPESQEVAGNGGMNDSVIRNELEKVVSDDMYIYKAMRAVTLKSRCTGSIYHLCSLFEDISMVVLEFEILIPAGQPHGAAQPFPSEHLQVL